MDWDEGKQEAEPCPACGHYYTMATESKDAVNADNEEVKAAHQVEVHTFYLLPATERKDRKRPSKKKTKFQTIACYCFLMNCL